MQSRNRFLDDLAKLAAGAAGAFTGLRDEIEEIVRQRVERLLERMDLVHREEFEAVKAMAAKAREENEALAARVAVLEAAAKPRRAAAGGTRRKRAPSGEAPDRGQGGLPG